MSYADIYRPDVFLMENVSGLGYVTKTGKLGPQASTVVLTLLEMGYQVNCGAVQAGAHGVPQSRLR